MAFVFNSRVKIGKYTFEGGFNDLTIKKSVLIIMDTATMRIPALGYLIQNGNFEDTALQTAKLFTEGMPVKIELGYNGNYNTEFEGFVRRVSPASPIVLEMEGYGWQLRRKNIMQSWKNTTLLAVAQELVKGTDIALSDKIPDVPLQNLPMHNKNGLECLEILKDRAKCVAYFRGNELYIGLQQLNSRLTVKYKLGWNTVRDDKLKYRLADDTRVLVRVTKKLKKGKQLLYEVGDKDGAIHTIKLNYINGESDIKTIGDNALIMAKYTGYEGGLTALLEPYCKPGDTAEIIDTRANERDGKYFVTSTEVTYSTSGAKRIANIQYKLN